MNSMQKWIYQPRGLSMAARILLPYYCARANGELACFPSYSRTEGDCELTRKSVVAGTKELCRAGLLQIVKGEERTAILVAAGAQHNCRANVYRISFSKPAHDSVAATPSDSVAATPSSSNGGAGIPSKRDLEAELLAMCVPFGPEDDAPDGVAAPPTDGVAATPGIVEQLPIDGIPAPPELLNELKESELQAGAEAPAGSSSSVARTLSGAPSSSSPVPDKGAPGAGGRAATIGGDVSSLPVLRYGPPPDPFADAGETKAWLSRSLGRAVAAAVVRPKAIYAPPADIAAARAELAGGS